MSNNINENNSNKINYFKKLNQKTGKKVDLCQKYFYKLNLSPKKCNIFQLMENGLSNQDELEQVDNACIKFINNKNLLEKKQIECLKSKILHHKQIPEKWIIQRNYKDLLNKVMSDPIVLNYAIESKDIFKKRSTSVSIDDLEVEKIMKENISSPKFISYINPYSKNYADSIEKHRLMREYCYGIKNKKNRVRQNIQNLKNINLTENNKIKENKKNYYLNTEATKEYILPCIYPNKKEKKAKSKNKENKENKKKEKEKDEKDETLMMTSLYFDENKLNKENKDIKDIKDNLNNKDNLNKEDNNKINDELNSEKNIKRNSVELPMIE